MVPSKILSIIALLFFSTDSIAQKTIRIYHGLTGTSAIIDQEDKVHKSSYKLHAKQGEDILIEVVNAHTGLYEYNFKSTKTEIPAPEIPDVSELAELLNGVMNLEIPEDDSFTVDIIKGSFESAPLYNPIPIISMIELLDIYKSNILNFKSNLEKMSTIIKDSDAPLNLEKSISYSNEAGFKWAKKELSMNEIFEIDDLDKYYTSKSDSITKVAGYDLNKKQLVFYKELLDAHFKSLVETAKAIRKAYGNKASTTYNYKAKVDEKKNTLTLSIKAKESYCQRDSDTSLLEIIIIPEIKRPILELTPVAVMHSASEFKKYSIENSTIVESDDDGIGFSAGGVFNINVARWGARKEFSLATGLGFAYQEESLNNLFLSLNVNYGKWARLGVGYGYLRTPSGLKNGLKPGDTVTDIENIDDAINYGETPAFFITFVIPGLNLPLLGGGK